MTAPTHTDRAQGLNIRLSLQLEAFAAMLNDVEARLVHHPDQYPTEEDLVAFQQIDFICQGLRDVADILTLSRITLPCGHDALSLRLDTSLAVVSNIAVSSADAGEPDVF